MATTLKRTVQDAKISPTVEENKFYSIPVQSWKWQSLIQAFCYARDPRDGKEYIFATQARETGPGDTEDTYVHRHSLVGDKVTYLDTMRCVGFGHMQSLYVRISAKGNPQIIAGVSQYNSKGKGVGSRAARFMYRKGVTITKKSHDFAYINTGKGNWVTVLGAPTFPVSSKSNPNVVVIRRTSGLTETYEELRESDVIRGVYKPRRKFKVSKVGRPGPYQGAAYAYGNVYIVNGKTNKTMKIYQHALSGGRRAGTLDITKLASAKQTSQEPEGLGVVRGVLHVGKRFGSLQKRAYRLFGLRW